MIMSRSSPSMIGGGNLRSIDMSNIVSLDEYRKKKEEEAERQIANELHMLLSELMLDDEPVIITYEDSDGTIHTYNLNELSDLTDSSD